MARPKAPCGTYSAYKRHLRDDEVVDAACEAARDARTSADAAARKANRAQNGPSVAFEPAPEPEWDDAELISRVRSDRSRRDDGDVEPKTRAERLRWNLDLIEAAMDIVAGDEPAKLAPLSKRHSELLDELRRIDGDQPVKDAFDEFLGDGASNVVGISTAASRKQA